MDTATSGSSLSCRLQGWTSGHTVWEAFFLAPQQMSALPGRRHLASANEARSTCQEARPLGLPGQENPAVPFLHWWLPESDKPEEGTAEILGS